jgi:hypothetical protein
MQKSLGNLELLNKFGSVTSLAMTCFQRMCQALLIRGIWVMGNWRVIVATDSVQLRRVRG